MMRIYNALMRRLWYFINKPKYLNLGKKTFIRNPLDINGSKNISLGKNVYVGYKTWLAAVPHTNLKTCELRIGNGTRIGNFNHIYSTSSIFIGENVLTADKVYISDNLHSYDDINIPILNQSIKQISNVIIGDNSWLGENVCIIGAKIGRHCVVGANSVVTKDIPDYCVVVGIPAKIIKRYDFDKKAWLKTDKEGNFIN